MLNLSRAVFLSFHSSPVLQAAVGGGNPKGLGKYAVTRADFNGPTPGYAMAQEGAGPAGALPLSRRSRL